MPIHDWTRVTAGTFHAFHNSWITHLQESLNEGTLPEGYYALGEQRSGDIGPDVLTLREQDEDSTWAPPGDEAEGMIAVAERPPQVSWALEADMDAAFYMAKRRTLVIYHATKDRVVAFIEIVSPGNKHGQRAVESFLDKALAALREGIHLLVIDLIPPGRHDPAGIHGLIWEAVDDEPCSPPTDRPLTLASYCAKSPVAAYVEPMAVGSTLPDMPLFLTTEHYINVPLESTYERAWRGVPGRWRRVLEE